MSLNNLGNLLTDLGRREDALAATRGGRAPLPPARRRPARRLPPRPRLSLNNLGIRLSDLGRREDALAAAQEAVDLRRQLAADRPDAFLPDLATSLNNLGNLLSDLGPRARTPSPPPGGRRHPPRARRRPPRRLPPRPRRSLNNLGTAQRPRAARGRPRRLRRPSTSAALAAARPDAFLPDLAMSLNNLGNRLSDLGRREDALAAANEAVRALRPHFLQHPAAFADWMVTMVRNYLQYAEAAGVEPDEALLAPIAEALEGLKQGGE